MVGGSRTLPRSYRSGTRTLAGGVLPDSGKFPPIRLDPAEEEGHREEVFRRTAWHPERTENSPTTVWIDRGTLLVRRIEEETRFETFSTEQVTEYAPEAGVAVGEDELRFDPPGKETA